MGNKLCDCDANSHKHIIQNYELITDDVKLDCLICKQEFPPVEFNHHLDNQHFLAIRDKATGIVCECIICGEDSLSIERHQEHLKSCHFELDDEIKSPQHRTITNSNSQLKAKIQQVRIDELSGFAFTGRLDNKRKVYRGWLAGTQYKIIEVEQREQTGLAERYNVSNLVWKPIFTEYLDTLFYAIDKQDGRARRSYLLMQAD